MGGKKAASRLPPLTEIEMIVPAKAHHHYGLRFLSYGVPWVAWLLNVSILSTCHFQQATLKLCRNDDEESEFCVHRYLSLGLAKSCERTSSSNLWSIEDPLNDLANEDYYTKIALGSAIVPVALGTLLVCVCCGPVLLGEFEQGQTTLWTMASLVHLINAVFSALALIVLKTSMCDGDICGMVHTEEKFFSFSKNDQIDDWACQEDCTPGAGFYLAIVATALWMLAFLGTALLKKAHQIKTTP